ncbi:MAG: efflux RND transporter permease subunit, partial [Myxococcota bacterium]
LSHSIQYVAIALVTIGVALLWTFGLLGWLDWPQDGILEVLAPLILIVGVCDAVHLLSRYAVEMPDPGDSGSREQRRIAVLAASHEIGPPCLITTLTTCGAFLSFVTSALDTFIRFGVISAFGVAACLLLTFTLLPLLTVLLPTKGARAVRASNAWRLGLDAVISTSERRATPILLFATAGLAICGTGWLSFLRVDTSWIESFGEQSRVVQSIRFVEDRVRPNDTLEIAITLPSDSPLEDPATLKKIKDMSEFISEIDGMGAATSIVDYIARLNRVLNDDHPAFERPGSSFATNAELIELIGFDDPDFLRTWTSLDRSRVRVSIRAPEQSYTSRGNILRSVDRYIQSELPNSWKVNVGGGMAIHYDWIRDVQSTQLRSFPTAFLIVFVMVGVFLRSIRLSLAAMVPTVLPVVVTLGTMGLMGMSLDIGRAMIAAILLGIAVDDSIHVLRRYEVRRSLGDNPKQAIREAILHTGRAVVTTSLALSLGFLTLMASAWQTISSFGFFVALAIMGALAAVLFVLPALIFTFARER